MRTFRTYHPVFPSLTVTLVFTLCSLFTKAQQVDSIYFHPYTDSLKKGTYNYINVDGLLKSGRYIPLDSTHVEFTATLGFFRGNSLWVPLNTREEKVTITATLRKNKGLTRSFTIYVKQLPDNEVLETKEEILERMKNEGRDTRKKKKG